MTSSVVINEAPPSERASVNKTGGTPSIPRAGIARALAGHVARGFGTRRCRRRVFSGLVGLLEAYNEELHRLEPMPDNAARRLSASVLEFWSTLKRVGRSDPLVERILSLTSTSLSALGDATVPECVVFLRAVVSAGVVAGDVPEASHHALDRFAIALGLSWEAARGELTAAGWRDGLALLNQRPDDGLPTDARGRAQQLARAALVPLSPAPAVAPLIAFLLTPIEGDIGTRRCTQYEPCFTQTVCMVTTPPSLGGFTATWLPQLERAMAEAAHGSSHAFVRATAYLQAQGGKRFRGLLTLAAAAANGGDPTHALEAAAAVEWLHQTSLILDDIVDEAHTRRGARCLHRLTSPVFTVATSAFLVSRCGETVRALPRDVTRVLLDTELALLKGECLEVSLEPGARANLATYYRIIEAKTASLFSCAATAGALCARGADDPARVRALARYGREIGLAFQIIDDLLDYTGDEQVLGKRPGTDFRNGRLTLPALLLAEAMAIPAHADFAWTREAIEASGIAAQCHARGRRHVEQALAALSMLPAGEARVVLERIAWAILDRRS